MQMHRWPMGRHGMAWLVGRATNKDAAPAAGFGGHAFWWLKMNKPVCVAGWLSFGNGVKAPPLPPPGNTATT